MLKECPKHGMTEYIVMPNGNTKCKKCRNEAVKNKRKKLRLELIEYKGGKCEICGYCKCYDALEFHHKNPEEKEFGISNGNTVSIEKLKKEVDKCSLLCANCHREVHANINLLKTNETKKIENEHLNNFFNGDFKKGYRRNDITEKLNKKNIFEDINNNLTNIEISRKYKVSLSTLKRFLTKNNIVNNKKNKLSFLTKEKFINDFLKYGSFKKLGELYGTSDKAISKWCKKNDLPYRKQELLHKLNIIL